MKEKKKKTLKFFWQPVEGPSDTHPVHNIEYTIYER